MSTVVAEWGWRVTGSMETSPVLSMSMGVTVTGTSDLKFCNRKTDLKSPARNVANLSCTASWGAPAGRAEASGATFTGLCFTKLAGTFWPPASGLRTKTKNKLQRTIDDKAGSFRSMADLLRRNLW
jgi:hypothetical protein